MDENDFQAWADNLRNKYGIAFPIDTSEEDVTE